MKPRMNTDENDEQHHTIPETYLRVRGARFPPVRELSHAVLPAHTLGADRRHNFLLHLEDLCRLHRSAVLSMARSTCNMAHRLAVLNYFMTGFSSLANSIRQEQMQGTLESVLLTPINLPTIIVASSAWDFLETTFFSFLYLFFGWVFFGVHYKGSFFLALVFLLLTTVVLACLGILSASFAMVFKRGDPFGIFLGAGSALFSGVFFPTQLLKTYAGPKLGNISLILPTTHGLDGIRQVLIEGHGFAQVTQPLMVLLGFFVVLLPFSLWVFGRAVRRAKREGSLIQY